MTRLRIARFGVPPRRTLPGPWRGLNAHAQTSFHSNALGRLSRGVHAWATSGERLQSASKPAGVEEGEIPWRGCTGSLARLEERGIRAARVSSSPGGSDREVSKSAFTAPLAVVYGLTPRRKPLCSAPITVFTRHGRVIPATLVTNSVVVGGPGIGRSSWPRRRRRRQHARASR